MKCNVCAGRRVITRTVPEIRRSQGVDYTTGRDVERLFQCDTCGGTGHLPEPDPTPPAAAVVYCGAVLEAPGFTSESFTAALHRARSRGTMPMIGAGSGVVLVESARTGERYHATRETCSCPGSQSHGTCMHRAAAIAAHDLYGVDVCNGHVLGFDACGHIITAADRVAALEGAA
jgi:hypothetical protein